MLRRVLDLPQTLMTVAPPNVNFGFVSVNAGLLFVGVAVDRQAFLFPAAHRSLAALQIRGNFLPRVQTLVG